MGSFTSLAILGALHAIPILACAHAPAQEPAASRSAEARIPPGAERAVAAALAANPGAVLLDVVTPSGALGVGGPNDAIWTLHIRADGARKTLDVSGDGVLIHANRDVETKDLPALVGERVSKVAPAGASKITKLETLGVLRYVALPAPVVRYVARLSNDGGAMSLTISPDGKVLDSRIAKEKKAPAIAKNARTADAPIPEQAAAAVRAVRDLFPTMIFDLVEEVPYVDSTTQTMTMVWYEVEFFLDGVKKQVDATPDGVVIAYSKPVPIAELPKAAADALASAIPNSKIDEVVKSETRAGAKFVSLDLPVVVYAIEARAGGAAEASAPMKLRSDGTEVQEPDLPDWAKKPAKKESKETAK
jgi:hypothetical protein